MPPVEIIAHRGASFDAPENTLAAVELAWQQAADAVEIDCRLTEDGQIIVIHDRNTRRTSGESLRVDKQPFKKLRHLDVGLWKGPQFAGEPLPLLSEVIGSVPVGRRLFIEVKCGPEIIPPLTELLCSGGPLDRFVVISYDRQVVGQIKEQLPAVSALLIGRCGIRASATGSTIAKLIEIARDCKLDGLDLDAACRIDAEVLDAIQKAGLACYCWCVDEPSRAAQLIALGVKGITTNRPGLLREQLTEELMDPERD